MRVASGFYLYITAEGVTMHAAIRSPLAAGVALIGAGTIAATPIAATPPDVHISDLRLTLSSQIMSIQNPIVLGERLVSQTLTDVGNQARNAAGFPIAKALVLNVTNALGGRVDTKSYFVTAGTDAAKLANGGGLLGTVRNVVVDGVVTTVRLVPATVGAVLGVATSTVNAVALDGLAGIRAVLNVGAAALTLNPLNVVDAAALGAVRVAGVVEQTTIGTPSLAYMGPPAGSNAAPTYVARRTPSIVSSILQGRREIANAIFPSAQRLQAATPAVTSSVASKPVAKATASTTKAITGSKHAKK